MINAAAKNHISPSKSETFAACHEVWHPPEGYLVEAWHIADFTSGFCHEIWRFTPKFVWNCMNLF